jgi:hypothetical protein
LVVGRFGHGPPWAGVIRLRQVDGMAASTLWGELG